MSDVHPLGQCSPWDKISNIENHKLQEEESRLITDHVKYTNKKLHSIEHLDAPSICKCNVNVNVNVEETSSHCIRQDYSVDL